jgi:hypothetical protein
MGERVREWFPHSLQANEVRHSTTNAFPTHSSVGIATRLRGGRSGVRLPARAGNATAVSRPALGPTQPPIQWVPAGGGLSVGKAAGA